MVSALRSFITTTSFILIGCILAGIFFRYHALSEPIREPFPHPFFAALEKSKPAVIAWSGGSGESPERPPNTFAAFDHAAGLDPNVILWADVRPSKDGTLMVFSDRDLASTTDGKGWISYTSDEDLAKLDAGFQFTDANGGHPYRGQGLKIPTLNEVLLRYPKRFFVLNFRDYQPGMSEKVAEALTPTQAAQRVLVMSPEDGFLRDMREKHPDWIFGTSQAQTTRMLMAAEFALEPLVTIRGDVFVAVPEENSTPYDLESGIIKELRRRKMKILIGPPLSKAELDAWRAAQVDGIITSEPEKLLRELAH